MTVEASLKAKMRKYQREPLAFVREVLRVEPSPQQISALEAISPTGSKVSIRSGHGTGKSTVMAWIVLWHVTCFPDSRVPCTAPTGHQLKDVLWAEIAKWRNQMHPWFSQQVEVESERVYLIGRKETQFAVARTARQEKPEALQGFHATNLMFLVDEASGVPEPVFEVAQGALSTPQARALMAANPTQTSGYFYQSHHRMKHRWKTLQFSCLDSPLVSEEYILDIKEKYGEDSDMYRVRVLGDFPKQAIRQLIPRDLAEASAERIALEKNYFFLPKVIGVDIAGEGDDQNCVFLRQGMFSKMLGRYRTIDKMTLGGLIAQFEDKYRTDATFIDFGWGTGVVDYLRSIGRNPIPVNFGGSPINGSMYVNKRAEMWCEMKNWMEEGGIIPDEVDLIEDLTAPMYHFAPNGKIGLEPKKDIKKRGLPSPDLADALALTFAAPVESQYDSLPSKIRKNFCEMECDLFL